MPLSLVRIDDRLIHGQVVEGWIPHLRAELVIVVSDAAAADPVQAALMKLALPEEVDLEILGIAAAADHAVFRGTEKRRALVLAPGPLELLGLLDRGAKFALANVGGLHYTAGKVQLGKAIFLSDLDRDALKAIAERGVKLEGRALPNDCEEDLLAMLSHGEPR